MPKAKYLLIVFCSLVITKIVMGMDLPLMKSITIEGQSILSNPSFSSDGTKIAVLLNAADDIGTDSLGVINAKTGVLECSFKFSQGYFSQVSSEIFLYTYEYENNSTKAQILSYPFLDVVMSCEDSFCHNIPTNIIWNVDGNLRLESYTFKDIMWDVRENKELYILKDRRFKKFSPDGAHIILSGPNLQIRNARTNNLLAEYNDAKFARQVALNQDGSCVASSLDSLVQVFETKAPYRKLLNLDGHMANINHLVFSPDGKRILTGDDDGYVILWDADTGGKIKIIKHNHRIESLAFNPRRPLILSLANGAAKISDANTGELKYEINAHESEINYAGIVNEFVSQAIFSPDGQELLTGIFNFTEGFITSTLWTIPDSQPKL